LFKTVYFDTGKSTFKKETFAKLDEAAVIMSKFSTAKFTIEGHTDSVGGDARNLELSQSRATAVKDYLVSKGVSSSNLDAKGYGEKNPIATNMNRAGRAQNRRVDVKLVN
jgi:outer membrane protein OmpA-like peptidoglycan-associated protein